MNSELSASDKLWTRCNLEGDALNKRVCELLGRERGDTITYPDYCGSWQLGGPVIESNAIFLDPPHNMHVSYVKGGGQWVRFNHWTATVSSRTRTYPNPNFSDPESQKQFSCVGRGSGPTPLLAAMRAFVDSFGP
jgi:hypothetical protein